MSVHTTRNWRRLALSSTALLCSAAALSPMSAIAQARAPAVQAGSNEGASQVQEVIVTAERRAESVQRSSASIQVLSSKALTDAGVSSAKDLTRVAPGVQIAMGGAFAQVYIRGVGSFVADVQGDPSVVFNNDDVVIGSNTGLGNPFYDLERVEVLKGPQGTLYGRNAAGGAINIVTAKPVLNKFSGFLTYEGGNYDLNHVTSAINVPIGNTFAIRAAIDATSRSGYFTDGTDDDKHVAGRIHALWAPNDKVSLLLTAGATHQNGKGAGASILPNLEGNPWLGDSSAAINAYLAARPVFGVFPLAPFRNNTFLDNKLWDVSAQLQADLGFAKLTVIPAFRSGNLTYLTNAFGYIDTDHTETQQSTLEVRLSSETEHLKWVAGGYWYYEPQSAHLLLDEGAFQHGDLRVEALDEESWAAFGEGTFSVTDRFRLIGGLRYSYEKTDSRGQQTVAGPLLLCGCGSLTEAIAGHRSDSALTWRAGVEYDLLANSMAYATVATGFKAGGVNLIAPGPHDTYLPEKLTAYTVGVRNQFFDRHLQLNVEGFYWDYKDKQEALFGVDGAGILQPFAANAGAATIYGASVDLVAHPWSGGTLLGSVEYVHSRYNSFSYLALGSTPPTTTGCPASFSASAGGFVVNCAGFPLDRTPEWSGSASFEQRFDLPVGGALSPRVEVVFASSRWLTADFLPPGRDSGYGLVNADLTYTPEAGRWSVTAWIRNIGNTPVDTGAFQGLTSGTFWATIDPPRTYGVRVSAEF